MYKTDKQWTLDNYTAVRTLNNKCLNPRTRRRVARIQTEEEAEKILNSIDAIEYLIDTEPEQAKCENCERRNKKQLHEIKQGQRKLVQRMQTRNPKSL